MWEPFSAIKKIYDTMQAFGFHSKDGYRLVGRQSGQDGGKIGNEKRAGI